MSPISLIFIFLENIVYFKELELSLFHGHYNRLHSYSIWIYRCISVAEHILIAQHTYQLIFKNKFHIDSINMVDGSSTIIVLEKFRPFLKILMIYHSRNYQNNSERFVHLCQIFAFSLVLIFFWLFIITDAWFCIDQQFDLNVIAQPISFLIHGIEMHFVYISIIAKCVQIDMIINRLQKIVEHSKCFVFLRTMTFEQFDMDNECLNCL